MCRVLMDMGSKGRREVIRWIFHLTAFWCIWKKRNIPFENKIISCAHRLSEILFGTFFFLGFGFLIYVKDHCLSFGVLSLLKRGVLKDKRSVRSIYSVYFFLNIDIYFKEKDYPWWINMTCFMRFFFFFFSFL